MLQYEALFEEIYGTGVFQIILTACCSLTCVLFAIEVQAMVLFHFTPDFNCTSRDLSEFSEVWWLDKAVFMNFNLSDTLNFSKNVSTSDNQCWAIGKRADDGKTEKFSCNQWQYSRTVIERSLVTEFNLICERKALILWLQTLVLMSVAMGYLFAMFSDRISRRRLLIFYIIWDCITIIAIPLSPNITCAFITRMLRMLSVASVYLETCIIAELLPINKRAIYANLYWLPYGVGYLASAGMAYLTRDYFVFRLYFFLPLLLYLPLLFLVPESPRWLTANSRHEEFIQVIKRIARWNSVNLPEEFFHNALNMLKRKSTVTVDSIDSEIGKNDTSVTKLQLHKESIMDVFRLPNMRTKSFVLCVAHAAIAFCYYGLITNSSYVVDNIFLNVFFQGLTELPSAMFGWVLSVYSGRRLSLTILLNLAAMMVALTAFVKRIQPAVSSVIAIVGRIAITTAYCISDLYVAELFPTTVRNLGIYLIMMLSVITSAIAPFINDLQTTVFYLPGVVYAGMCVISAALIYFHLPETKLCPLAQTLQQSEKLVRGHERQWILEMTEVK